MELCRTANEREEIMDLEACVAVVINTSLIRVLLNVRRNFRNIGLREKHI